MKIKSVGWISSRYYPNWKGGAERTDYLLRKKGKELGIDIKFLLQPTTEDFDFIIVGNTHGWNKNTIYKFIANRDFALFFHDVFVKPYTEELIDKAFITIFQSPLQREFYENKYKIKRYFYQPCVIPDIEKYHVDEKEDTHVYIGDLGANKGIFEIIKYARENKDKKFVLYGKNLLNIDFSKHPNIEYKGFVPEEEIKDILAKTKYYIQIPSLIDSCPGTCLGAYLSDCIIIGNDNVGLFSYKWNWKNKKSIISKLKAYPKKFWTEIDKAHSEEKEKQSQ